MEVLAWEALDSRGKPTVAARVRTSSGGQGRAVVPSGASRGSHEAVELRDGGSRYGGLGVAQAVANVRSVLGPAVRGLDATDQETIDAALEAADGTPGLSRLGANAVLAVSVATLLAAADAAGQPLYHWLLGAEQPLLPMPTVNIVSGGAHAGGAIDIQDVLAVPVGAGNLAQAFEWVWRVRAEAAALVGAEGGSAVLVADEGGLAFPARSNEAAVALVHRAIERAGLVPMSEVALGIDIAANQLLGPDGLYHLRSESRVLGAEEWVAELERWCGRHPIVSLEDVLAEDDWDGWVEATGVLGKGRLLVGDDLFATQVDRLARGSAAGVANAVLIKPNQAGTLTRAGRAVALAAQAGYATVASARSGDTEDAWLADLAIGWRCRHIKVGSLTRSERCAKWNRLLEVDADLGGSVVSWCH